MTRLEGLKAKHTEFCFRCGRYQGLEARYNCQHGLCAPHPLLRDALGALQDAEAEEAGLDAHRERTGALLTGVANALKGDPAKLGPHGGMHDWSDLPEAAEKAEKGWRRTSEQLKMAEDRYDHMSELARKDIARLLSQLADVDYAIAYQHGGGGVGTGPELTTIHEAACARHAARMKEKEKP